MYWKVQDFYVINLLCSGALQKGHYIKWPDVDSCVYIQICRRGKQNVVPPIFCFMLFTRSTCKNLTEFQNNTAECTVVFQCVSIWTNSLLPPLKKSTYSCLVTVGLSPLQPLAQDILQCLITGILVSS